MKWYGKFHVFHRMGEFTKKVLLDLPETLTPAETMSVSVASAFFGKKDALDSLAEYETEKADASIEPEDREGLQFMTEMTEVMKAIKGGGFYGSGEEWFGGVGPNPVVAQRAYDLAESMSDDENSEEDDGWAESKVEEAINALLSEKTITISGKGKAPLKFKGGALHSQLGVPAGKPIPPGKKAAALRGEHGALAKKRAVFAFKGALKTGRETAKG